MSAGGYDCVFLGRKPRAPGEQRMVLRQQIREKDAMIDNLLSQVNPGPTMATPLTLVPARLPLNQKERADYRDVLSYLERSSQQANQRLMGDQRVKFEIAALEDVVSEDDSMTSDDEAGGAGSHAGSSSPKRERESSPTLRATESVPPRAVESILEPGAPTFIMATAALQNARKPVPTESASDSTSSAAGAASNVEAGVAADNYYLPGPHANLQLRRLIIERQAAPDILLSGLVTPEDATALFEMYVATLCCGCPTLQVDQLCTVASKYYKEKPHIYGMAIHFAKAAAANAVIDGWKTVEMTQAFALWSVYNPPARRWEEDRAWCYTGIAFRLATELNLSRYPDQFADERSERESHNRTRMWLMCFIMDRCLSIQSGKAWMVQEDATIRDAASWAKNFKYHQQCDNYLVSLTELLIIMSRFVGTVNPAFGTSSVESVDEIDFAALYKAYDDELLAWKAVVDIRHDGEKMSKDPAVVMQITLIHCVHHYCRLVICCCGMQLLSKDPKTVKPSELFAGCVQAATSLVKLMVEDFLPSGFVPYFPELVYVHSAFAAVVLMKCLRPEFNCYLDIEQEERIILLVSRLFETWTSDNFSLDERHNPQIYARFVKGLMESHLTRLADKKRAAAVQASGTYSANSVPPPPPPPQPQPQPRTPEQYTNGAGRHGVPTSPINPSPTFSSTPSSLAAAAASMSPHSPVLFGSPGTEMPFGDLYATDLDITQLAAAAGQHMADTSSSSSLAGAAGGMLNVPWDALFSTASGDLSGGVLSGPFGSGDVTSMMGGESLAALMGLESDAWFLPS
ncbi:uncharacterized protein BXZ73DRAFT_92869 [Epithele typhae]|uniref:uncharacterized protein n=1 Tax=Epithele typhae TaxID=378194 RepID=UPI0020072A3C|nr:uncharacterized protein BXZ73DRAFT_92869 [Epithele typhae]KAH9914089.1 hypothetical protein BXZ73DRAFT_92869 [Epithele typhae]